MSNENAAARHKFAGSLEAAQPDPVALLDMLQTGLRLEDPAVWRALNPEFIVPPAEELGEAARQTVQVLGRMTMLFSQYGTKIPADLGRWYSTANNSLWAADKRVAPFVILGMGAADEGPTQDNIGRVFIAANTFFHPDSQRLSQVSDVIMSGARDLTLPHYGKS